jgi:transposase-like protein
MMARGDSIGVPGGATMAKLKARGSQSSKSNGKGEVTKLIRKTREATRKGYTARGRTASAEKNRIVMEGIRCDDAVSTICRREGTHSNLYYSWLKEFMEAGKARLKGDEQRGATRGELSAAPLWPEIGQIRRDSPYGTGMRAVG